MRCEARRWADRARTCERCNMLSSAVQVATHAHVRRRSRVFGKGCSDLLESEPAVKFRRRLARIALQRHGSSFLRFRDRPNDERGPNSLASALRMSAELPESSHAPFIHEEGYNADQRWLLIRCGPPTVNGAQVHACGILGENTHVAPAWPHHALAEVDDGRSLDAHDGERRHSHPSFNPLLLRPRSALPSALRSALPWGPPEASPFRV